MTDITPENGATPTPPDLTGSAKQMLGDAGRAVKDEAVQFAGAATDKAKGALDRQKETATRTLGDFADAVRKAGDELNQRDQSMAGRLIGQAADSLEGLSRSMADKRPEELIDAVRDFGRRNPAAFIGGAVLVGLAIGRFARASAHNDAEGGDRMSRRLGQGDQWRERQSWSDGPIPVSGTSRGMSGQGGQANANLYGADLSDGETFNTASGAMSQGGSDGGGVDQPSTGSGAQDIERGDISEGDGALGRSSRPEV
jgi:hypothetical protein